MDRAFSVHEDDASLYVKLRDKKTTHAVQADENLLVFVEMADDGPTGVKILHPVAWRQIRRQVLEEAARRVAENRLVSGSIGPLMDIGWNEANEAAAYLLRRMADEAPSLREIGAEPVEQEVS